MSSTDRKEFAFSILAFAALMVGFYVALFHTPTEAQMGDIYRIIYVHVPSAAVAMGGASVLLLIFSVIALFKVEEKYLTGAHAASEIGLLFTLLTLITGSIWGKPTWGTWWTWDARLTTTLLLAILFTAYLMLHHSLAPGKQRIRVCSVFGIIIFFDVPIIYKSVSWWRTLHQPASLIEQRGSTMDPEMLSVLLYCIGAMFVFAFMLWRLRFKNLTLAAAIERASLEHLKG